MPRAAKDSKSAKSTKAKSPAKGANAKKVSTTAKSAKSAKPTKGATAAKPSAKPAKKAQSVKSVTPAKPASSAKPAKTVKAAPMPKATPKPAPRPAPKPYKRTASSEFSNFEPYQPRRGEKYMNEKQLSHFKAILLNWKSELMQEVDRTVTHMKDEAANFPDPADRATQEEEFSLELRTRDRERKLIKKIDATMELIDQDEYGFCEACGVEIGIQRLEARPTATQCIDCKTLAEIKEKQEMG